jgi:hypothetical protein
MQEPLSSKISKLVFELRLPTLVPMIPSGPPASRVPLKRSGYRLGCFSFSNADTRLLAPLNRVLYGKFNGVGGNP